ncbi:MAG: hypothetical protein KF752_02850 [Pirellulaceae bacterium]|nr:hypothetical protein [Pirellulaceae bacterium]
MPLFAKALVGLKDSLTFKVAGETFSIAIGLPFSWKLFFFAAASFSLATAIFQIKCPKIIQEHDDYSGFTNAGKGRPHLEQYVAELKQDAKSFGIPDPRDNDFAEHLCEAYWKIRTASDETHSKLRTVCMVCNYVGMALIGIVASQNVYYVIRATFNW